MRGYTIFNHGKIKKERIPTKQEFNKMQECINESFNFIWSDIVSVHHHLNKQYDFIHLSNIFEHLPQNTQIEILCNLSKFVRPNGIIYFISNPGNNLLAPKDWNITNLFTEHILQRVR